MIDLPIWSKFLISIIIDIIDGTFGIIPGTGHILDLIFLPVGIALWGNIAFIQVAEIADISNLAMAIVPTFVIMGVISVAMDSGMDIEKIKGSVRK